MANAPTQQPLIDIPDIEIAAEIELHVKGRGDNLVFLMFVDGQSISLDPDKPYVDIDYLFADEVYNDTRGWMTRDWFGILIRELDRRGWHYNVFPATKIMPKGQDVLIFKWTKI